LAQALQFLEKNPERVVTVPELALQVGVSSRQLIRLFVQIVGEGPARYHRRLRLEHARSLLRNTALPVTEAAVASGFESLAHFCRAYHHHFGQAPGADRRSAVQPRPLARDKSR
jgi:transcriptional regulator GlxA family with amidase domain